MQVMLREPQHDIEQQPEHDIEQQPEHDIEQRNSKRQWKVKIYDLARKTFVHPTCGW